MFRVRVRVLGLGLGLERNYTNRGIHTLLSQG